MFFERSLVWNLLLCVLSCPSLLVVSWLLVPKTYSLPHVCVASPNLALLRYRMMRGKGTKRSGPALSENIGFRKTTSRSQTVDALSGQRCFENDLCNSLFLVYWEKTLNYNHLTVDDARWPKDLTSEQKLELID